jgi:hypothetical protein
MFVVLDTNIWLRELGLNSTLGAATRFYVRNKKAQLALPEVVRLESEVHFRRDLKDFIHKISDNHRKLLTIFGSLKEIVLPNDDQLEAKVTEIFTSIGVDVLDIPFSLESARDSFLKTIASEPPSDRDQQFKDGVLWADCRTLLKINDVYLVTEDKAFYCDRKYEFGLARNLKAEISGANHSFRLFSSLGGLLSEIKSGVPIDKEGLLQLYLQQEQPRLKETLAQNGFALGATVRVQPELYVTENPSVLYLQFSAEIACEDATDQGRADARLLVKGRGRYNVESATFGELQSSGEELSFHTPEGEQVVRNVVIRIGSIVLEHRNIVHTIRHKLDIVPT